MAGEKGAKVKAFFGEFKDHWNTPKEGRYVPYKEYLSVFFGVGGDYALQRVLNYLSFGTGCFLVIFYYENICHTIITQGTPSLSPTDLLLLPNRFRKNVLLYTFRHL